VSRQWAETAAQKLSQRSTDFERYAQYRDKPVEFARDVLGVHAWEHPHKGGFGKHGQGDLLRAVVQHPRVSARSGHKTSKSCSAACIALWWYCTRREARVVITAPTDRQVRKVIWREIRARVRAAGLQDQIVVPKDPGTGVQAEDGREIFGFSASDPDAFSGISGAELLYIIDEAPGVKEEIFEAIEGNSAGGARWLMLGNPTQPVGTFADSHHKHRKLYLTLHIDSRDAAEFGGGIPGLATKEWCERAERKWGLKSALHDVRVKGAFAQEGTRNVISLALVERAKVAFESTNYFGRLVIGLDVAREGDDETVIMPVRGKKTYSPEFMREEHGLELILRGADGEQIAQQVRAVAMALRDKHFDGADPIRVNIDVIGVGASPYDAMCYHHRDVLSPCAVNAGHAADDEEQYVNLRAQLHFALADWFREGGAIHDDEDLDTDLMAAEYGFDVRHRLKVERKEDIKKRLGRSPDRSDALALAVYGGDYEMPDLDGFDRLAGSRWDGMGGRGFG